MTLEMGCEHLGFFKFHTSYTDFDVYKHDSYVNIRKKIKNIKFYNSMFIECICSCEFKKYVKLFNGMYIKIIPYGDNFNIAPLICHNNLRELTIYADKTIIHGLTKLIQLTNLEIFINDDYEHEKLLIADLACCVNLRKLHFNKTKRHFLFEPEKNLPSQFTLTKFVKLKKIEYITICVTSLHCLLGLPKNIRGNIRAKYDLAQLLS